MTEFDTNGAQVSTPDLPASDPDLPQRITRLSALDELFEAYGEVTLTMQRGGRAHKITLPIQTVDNELVESMARPHRPKTPVYRDQVNGQWVTIQDQANQKYQDELEEYNRKRSYIWVCLAMAVDICDANGTVVWSKDNSIHELHAARQALKRMGFVDSQLLGIMRAAQALTQVEEDRQASDSSMP